MAVSVQAPFYSKSGMWNLGDPSSTFSSTGTEGIPSSISYQYPLASSGLDSSSGMIPSYHHPPLDHAQPDPPAQGESTSSTLKKQSSSASSKSAKIRKSMSTPNVRGQASAEAAALALSADKRRNKLGYHRTSVACGHCRRRKIRCIPAPADPQNRCSNCIRLKKECNFYPVDQQPPPDPRRRGSKAQSRTERASEESSSPSTSSGQLPEMPQTLPYPHLSMPPIQDLGGPQMKRQRTESFSPENKGAGFRQLPQQTLPNDSTVVTSSRNFEYNHGPTSWMAPDASPSMKAPAADVPQSFWRTNPQDSPLTPAFSPFTPNLHIPPPQNWPAPHTDASPRDEVSWSVPQRSISYSNLEGLHSQHQQYPQYSHPPSQPVTDHYTTKPRILPSSGMYPPPISTSGSSIPPPETSSAGAPDTPQQPHSASSLPPVPYSNWQQPYSYQKASTSGSEQYGGWNAPHGSLPHLQGPPPAGEGGHGPPNNYGYSSGGMYYPPPPPHSGR